MSTLVVGGTGLLGRAVCERLDDATPVSRRTGYDFFDPGSARRLRAADPDAVVLAATVERADVPRDEYDEAVDRFVDACEGRRLVYVSSDAVFSGETGGYAPDDPVSPIDRYGRRLLAFERAVDRLSDAVVLRPSYLYAADPLDSRLAAAVEALTPAEGADEAGTYERFDDMYRSPAHVDDVAAAVVVLVAGETTGTLHVPGPRLSVFEFHRRALTALGVDVTGLEATSTPDGLDLARDRSLVAPRFDEVTGVEVGAPEARLEPR